MNVRFALLSEGTSEHPLVPHLQDLCVRLGADEAEGFPADLSALPSAPGKRLPERLRALVEHAPGLDFIFVHRDADAAGDAPRRGEIQDAARTIDVPVVPVIPITMLEAWLLLDADTICQAVSARPQPRHALSLPAPAQVEQVRDPKALLKQTLARASGASGRRLKKVHKDFFHNRRFLIERLDLDGPINDLSAWKRLLEDLQQTLARLLDAR